MIWEFFARVLVYGCFGVVMEVVFTGLHSIIFLKDRNARSTTSIWCIPMYGFGGVALGLLRWAVPFKPLFIPLCTLSIFVMEYIWGWMLRLIKVKIWDYSHAKLNLHGLIRADYIPFWLMVAVAFDILVDYLTKILEFVGRTA